MGLYANLDLLQAKVACDQWDMLVLVETWMCDLPGDLIRHLYAHRYTAHHLPATMSCVPAARDRRGILILIRDCWYVHGVERRRCDFREYIQLHIHGLFHVVALYRATHNTICVQLHPVTVSRRRPAYTHTVDRRLQLVAAATAHTRHPRGLSHLLHRPLRSQRVLHPSSSRRHPPPWPLSTTHPHALHPDAHCRPLHRLRPRQ